MTFSADNVIQERFARNGVDYDCMIAPSIVTDDTSRFQVVMYTSAVPQFASFSITPTIDGHWQPDNRTDIDPWLADVIGHIILDNF